MKRKITTPIYVINLDSSPERLQEVETEFGKHGLSFTRIRGVEFDKLPEKRKKEVFSRAKLPIIKHPISSPEIGCFLSHYDAWKIIAEGTAPMGVVCEDDATPGENFRAALSQIENTAPTWDILRLYSHKQEEALQTEEFITGHHIVTVAKITMSTVAYAITRQAAQQLVQIALPIGLPVDVYLKRWWLHKLCSKQVWPSVIAPVATAEKSSAIAFQRASRRHNSSLVRFWRNVRYQYYLNQQRKKHIGSLPLSRQFF